MVWIHGGGFLFSAGRSYVPSLLVALHNVIVVTINYRLGVLGFFNVPGTDVKGNYGSYDQILSLKWVQQNIAAFGGNPDQVTIFGESAGGMSVSSLLISPLSKGLFHRVIAQSGSSVSQYSCNRVSSIKGLEVFSKAINCDGKDRQLLDCVSGKSFNEIIAGQKHLWVQMGRSQFLTKPNVDGEFLPDDPKVLFKNGQFNKVDVMMGVNKNEGAFYLLSLADRPMDEELLRNVVRNILLGDGSHSSLSEDAIMMEYLDRGNLTSDRLRQVAMDIITDGLFLAPAVYEANILSIADFPVYFYVFDHLPHIPRLPAWLGTCHCLDLAFTFGIPLKKELARDVIGFIAPANFSALEEGLSEYFMQMWTNFAKYGDPNGADHMPVTWPQYNHEHVYLRLSTNPKLQRALRERQVDFWTEFFPKLSGTEHQSEASGINAKEGEKQKEEL